MELFNQENIKIAANRVLHASMQSQPADKADIVLLVNFYEAVANKTFPQVDVKSTLWKFNISKLFVNVRYVLERYGVQLESPKKKRTIH